MPTSAAMFNKAIKTIVPWGPYKGETIGNIGVDEKGLKWLKNASLEDWTLPRVLHCIRVFVNDPVIKGRMERMGV